MDCRLLTGNHLDLREYRLGTPQQAGCLTVMPITSLHSTPLFRSPYEAGKAQLRHASEGIGGSAPSDACILSPLHMCISVGNGKSALTTRVLLSPDVALSLYPETSLLYGDVFVVDRGRQRVRRGVVYGEPLLFRRDMWEHFGGVRRFDPSTCFPDDPESARLRQDLNMFPRMALSPQIQAWTQRIELLAGQTGALFFIDGRPVGLEIAPSPAYFATIWKPLLTGCYGLSASLHAAASPLPTAPQPFAISQLSELRAEMFRTRHECQEHLEAVVATRPEGDISLETNHQWQNYRVRSLMGAAFSGQYVEEVTDAQEAPNTAAGIPQMLRNLFRKGPPTNEEGTPRRVVYVSLFART